MSKVIVLMGLPGSGKTHFAEEYKKEHSLYNKWRVNLISVDSLMKKNRSGKKLEEVIAKEYMERSETNILDGLFLTNDDVIRVINRLPEKIERLHIHYWRPNIEYCLYNDSGRRSESSEVTIKNAKLEEPDAKRIKEATGVQVVTVTTHNVIKKQFWRKIADELRLHVEDGHYIYSEKWSLGGQYGNCWNSSMTQVSGDPEPADFVEFDDLLNRICPNISFAQNKRIYKKCVDTEEDYESDYYGGGITYAYYRCDLEKLFTILEENGLLDKMKKQKEEWIANEDPIRRGSYWVTIEQKNRPTSKIGVWNGYEWDLEEVCAWMPLTIPIPYDPIQK